MRRLWAILATPSPSDEAPHTVGAVAAWHGLAAMLVGTLFPGLGWLGPLGGFVLSFAAYWWAKERGDLRRGGGVADGIMDAAAVALGFWAGQALGPDAWWPIFAVNAAAVLPFAMRVWQEGR